MPIRDIIVIGASAGSIQTLKEMMSRLPADLPAAVFVVVHVSPTSMGFLPQILDTAGPLIATHPQDREPIERGRVYVAPPNHHMMIDDGRISLTVGPKENGFRPAVDPLFRTASGAYGSRVVGVILSGGLDDGTEGLRRIKQRGGVAIVQDPLEASIPGMPQSAINNVKVDHILPANQIPEVIKTLSRNGRGNGEKVRGGKKREADPAEGKIDALRSGEQPGTATPLTCPECGGVLWERGEKPVIYECHVGHTFTEQALMAEQSDQVEAALWTAVRALEESAELKKRMAQHARNGKLDALALQYERSAGDARRHADIVREALDIRPSGKTESSRGRSSSAARRRRSATRKTPAR
jgi:two-component system chemotaxis response regulator CheB